MTAPADDREDAPLHLLKMAVGVASLDELRRARAARIKQLGGSWVYTRNHPRRGDAVLAGGSRPAQFVDVGDADRHLQKMQRPRREVVGRHFVRHHPVPSAAGVRAIG